MKLNYRIFKNHQFSFASFICPAKVPKINLYVFTKIRYFLYFFSCAIYLIHVEFHSFQLQYQQLNFSRLLYCDELLHNISMLLLVHRSNKRKFSYMIALKFYKLRHLILSIVFHQVVRFIYNGNVCHYVFIFYFFLTSSW